MRQTCTTNDNMSRNGVPRETHVSIMTQALVIIAVFLGSSAIVFVILSLG